MINIVGKIEDAFASEQNKMDKSAFSRRQAILEHQDGEGISAIVWPGYIPVEIADKKELREAVNSGRLAKEVEKQLRTRNKAVATAFDEESGIKRVIEFTALELGLHEDGQQFGLTMTVRVSDDLYITS